MSSCASPTRGISWRSPIPGARSRVDARVRPALPPLHRQLHKGGPNTGLFLVVTADDAEDAEISGTLRLRLVPARVRVLEEQPDALAALLPGPVVARRREGQVAQDTLIQRPPDRPRCLHALGDDRLAVGSCADESIRGRLLPIAQHFDRVRHARAVRECDPGIHGRVPAELAPEDRAGSLRSQRSYHKSDEASVNRSTPVGET